MQIDDEVGDANITISLETAANRTYCSVCADGIDHSLLAVTKC